MGTPFPDRPSRVVRAPDGARIAVFSAGAGAPVLLVHGVTADHRTWRVVAPALARRYAVHAIDRRGRGHSTDGDPGAYAISRELEDLAAVSDTIATDTGQEVSIIGHSLGGRIALAASLRTPSIARVVAYESAPTSAVRAPGARDPLLGALRADLAAGEHERLLARFMTEGVGMPAADLAAFRADPVWPLRVAAAPTIVRELEASEAAPEIDLETLGRVTVPVLQLVGSASPAPFRDAAVALHARLARGRVEAIEGARHGAHHSHPSEFLRAIDAFVGE